MFQLKETVKCFQEVFWLLFKQLNGHLLSLTVYQYYKSVRIFDPCQLPTTLDRDIQVYSNLLKQLANPSCGFWRSGLFIRGTEKKLYHHLLLSRNFETVWLQGSLSYAKLQLSPFGCWSLLWTWSTA